MAIEIQNKRKNACVVKSGEEHTNGDITVGALKYLVHSLGAEGGAEDPGHRFSGRNVGFLSIQTSQSALLLLPPQYYEWPSELIEC